MTELCLDVEQLRGKYTKIEENNNKQQSIILSVNEVCSDNKHGLRNGNNQHMTTHGALAGPILLGQCCALFPISGVNGSQKARFNWKSLRFFYCLLHSLLQLVNTLFYVVFMLRETQVTFNYFVTLLFFTCSFVTTALFLRLAMVWPDLMKYWEQIDKTMDSAYGFPGKLRRTLIFTTTIIISAAVAEHGFFVGFLIINFINSMKDSDKELQEFWISFFKHVFLVLPFNWGFAMIWQVLNLFSTFNWNYTDLFIMLISLALSERFAQVNGRVTKMAEDHVTDEDAWIAIREDYDKLNVLSKMLDNALGNIILLSFANNLFVILVQLLHTLEPSNGDIVSRLYFMYSFGFLLLRTAAVALLASRIHSESTKSVDVLNQLPAEAFNEEIDRLLIQIKMDPSYFSGKGFFKVKKSLLLSIAGAIVSYELIFIQFSK